MLVFKRGVLVVGLLAPLFISPVFADPPSAPAEPSSQTEKEGQAKQETETAEKKAKESKFLRLLKDENEKPLALQTSIVRYKPTGKKYKNATVDLIGAVHVGDKDYYDQLNKAFESYDALLYELVAPEGTKIPKGGGKGSGGSPVSGLQLGMKSMLELEFQLERIDYTKKNFVHADMSPEEFAKSMKDNGESFLQMFFRMMGQSIAMQSKNPAASSDAQIFKALFAKDRALQLKLVMARQFEDMGGRMVAFEGPQGSTIITHRNKKALEVLRRELAGGKKRIGVFYGAGHLADMERRLREDFEMERAEEKWLSAWSLTGKKESAK